LASGSCRGSSPGRSVQKGADDLVELLGFLGEAQVGGVLDDDQLRSADPAVDLFQVAGRAFVVTAADQQAAAEG
jgi:hypothetical protein